ncbi:MAG: 50S ribosomal protein L15 [Clostridia bacterium]|nr:50S ribosomal protein L15 [Clostridia bacterium]
MKIHELQPAEGATTSPKRLGRGIGSGKGKTSGKGHKGQWARSGGGVRPGFEGGQMPLHRRVPKRGFHNKWATNYLIINLSQLASVPAGTVVDYDYVVENSLTKVVKNNGGLKVLGTGEVKVALTVKAAKFSESAKAAIEKAGGKAEVIGKVAE